MPAHTILHIFKVFLDDFTGASVENVALMLEGCGRFLLRTEQTRERMATMVRGCCFVKEFKSEVQTGGTHEAQASRAAL